MKILDLYKNSFKGLSKDIWFLAIIYFVNRCGEMVIPFMSVYLTDQLGFSKTQTGIVLFCFGMGALVGSNIGGYLTDAIGNFKVMALSLLGMGFAFSSIVFFKTFYLLSMWMFITAIFSSMFSPAAFSAVSLWGKPENITRGFTLLRMAINLGIAIGPAIGGLIAFHLGYTWIFIVDGATSLLALLTLFLLLKHRDKKYQKKEEASKVKESPYKDGVLVLFLILNLFNMIAFFQILFSVPVYFKEEIHLEEWMIGLFFTANGLIIFLLEMPLVYIIEQRNRFIKPLVMGALMIGVGYASLSLFSNPVVAIVIFSILIGVGETINFPLIPTLVLRRADTQNHGKYMGMVSTMFAMAFLLAPISGLPVIERIGFYPYWYLAAGMSLLSAICIWRLRGSFEKG